MRQYQFNNINLNRRSVIGFAGLLFVTLCGNLTFSNLSYAAYELEQEIDYTAQLVPERELFAEELPKTLKFKDDEKFFEHAERTRDFILKSIEPGTVECDQDQTKQFFFRNFTSTKQVGLLQKLFPNILESEQDWQSVSNMIDKLYRKFPSQSEKDFQSPKFKQAAFQFFSSSQFYSAMFR